jgi:hypothetical protein
MGNLNMGITLSGATHAHRPSRSSETSTRSFSLATSQLPDERSH